MNNGNLLNSLLGATGTGSAAGNHAPAKNRPDSNSASSEKFRDALSQARPDVAAPKPVPRKPTPEAQRHTATDARAGKPKEAPREASREEPRVAGAGANRKAEKPLTEKQSAEPPGKVGSHQPHAKESHGDGQGSNDNAGVGQSVAGNNQPQTPLAEAHIAAAETSTLLEPLPQVSQVLNPINMLDETEIMTGDLVVEASQLEGAQMAGVLVPVVEVETPGAGSSATTAVAMPSVELAAGVFTMTADMPTTDTPAPGLTLGEDGVALPATSASAPATPPSDLRLNPGSATGVTGAAPALVANPLVALVNQTGQTSGIGENMAVAVGDADSPVQTDVMDNPDFLILSGKAAFSKLMEANGSAEKAAQVVDPAKPALTTASLAEPLVRLSEAQSPAARSFVVQTGVPVPLGQPQWNQAVGEKVLWLAAQNVSAAEIRLDPPDLGPVHVKVTVNQDQASVSFTSPHAVVREALDQQLNRLREMFSEQGLNLVNVDVSDKSFAQQQGDEQGGSEARANDPEDEELLPVAVTTIGSTRLVDHYA